MSAVRKRENEHLSEVAGQLAKHDDDKHQSTLVVSGWRRGAVLFSLIPSPW